MDEVDEVSSYSINDKKHTNTKLDRKTTDTNSSGRKYTSSRRFHRHTLTEVHKDSHSGLGSGLGLGLGSTNELKYTSPQKTQSPPKRRESNINFVLTEAERKITSEKKIKD